MGRVSRLWEAIRGDAWLLPGMDKHPREKLALLVACRSETRRCNTMARAARLPWETEREEFRYAWPRYAWPAMRGLRGVYLRRRWTTWR